MSAVEQVVSREDLAAAVEAVRELLPPPGEGDDGDAEWRAALVDRYATVRPFIELLASVIPWGCTDAGTRILAALRGLPKMMAARKPGADHIRGFEGLVAGSWRRLVFASPKLEVPLIDRPAYVFCVLETLHDALRRRDVYAVGADKWGDPRVRLIEPRLWVPGAGDRADRARAARRPARAPGRARGVLDGAFKQVGAGLATNDAARIKDGKLSLARLEAAPPPEGFARPCTTRSRRCCPGSTTRSCCWRSTPAPGSWTRCRTCRGRRPAATTWTCRSRRCWSPGRATSG